ncbi:XAP5, circadian clock regulator-domain-containing protein [Gaertneriomyces semiglobifer]|nr:XAP5, circadian clock regulator-domain-containing protein [Gaertneriomyces semiglobifer]KAI9001622.1 XAP5, circadian clock regulator-domain-containing protein [Gaertneriomyces semiglobifer]
MLEKARTKMLHEFQSEKDRIAKEKQVNIGADKFVAQNDWVDNELKRQTIGLVKLEEFQRIKESLDQKRQEELEKDKAVKAELRKKKRKEKPKLSFDLDGEEDGEESPASTPPATKKIRKNPTVDTSFLPDRDREAEETKLREELKGQWLEEQERIKEDNILITYSYWDGTGHRKQVEVKKGNTIGQFLEACRKQWHELRGVNVDNLMYVKEDLIIPHHYTFYDFIINRTRGKSGPLFSFDVHDDVRLVNDARIETEESHAGKVLERAWYEKNKHIFPASRWEVFDPQKSYGNYTIADKNKNKDNLAP